MATAGFLTPGVCQHEMLHRLAPCPSQSHSVPHKVNMLAGKARAFVLWCACCQALCGALRCRHSVAVSLHILGAQLLLCVPQGLSNICWAHAKLGAEVTEEVARLLEALAVEAVSQLMDIRSRQKFIPQVSVPVLRLIPEAKVDVNSSCLHWLEIQ